MNTCNLSRFMPHCDEQPVARQSCFDEGKRSRKRYSRAIDLSIAREVCFAATRRWGDCFYNTPDPQRSRSEHITFAVRQIYHSRKGISQIPSGIYITAPSGANGSRVFRRIANRAPEKFYAVKVFGKEEKPTVKACGRTPAARCPTVVFRRPPLK